jgi:hypothetical protein
MKREEIPIDEDYEMPERGPMVAFLPNSIAWFMVWVIWIWGTIYLYTTYGQLGSIVGIFTGLTYHFYAYETIEPAERAVGIFQGRSTSVCESGPVFILKPFFSLPSEWRYSTKIQVIETDPIDIVTASGDYKNSYHGSAVTNYKFALYFKWSNKKSEILNAVKQAPNPRATGDLRTFLGRKVNDTMRQVGGGKVWLEMVQMGYAKDAIQKTLKGTGIIVTDIVNMNSKLPVSLQNALTFKEEAIYKGEAAVIIRDAILNVLKNDKYGTLALELEKMLTVRESAAAGNVTYLAFPSQIYDAINSRLPGQSLGIPTKEVNREIAKTLNKELGK